LLFQGVLIGASVLGIEGVQIIQPAVVRIRNCRAWDIRRAYQIERRREKAWFQDV